MITEAILESTALAWFEQNGWNIQTGSNFDRKDGRSVILREDLFGALRRLNPAIPDEALDDVVDRVCKPQSPSMFENNREFHKLLLKGVPVDFKVEEKPKHDFVKLIDFQDVNKNRFLAVNQFTIKGPHKTRRPDLICFINGLPLFVIELKGATEANADIWDAFNQLQNYKNDIPDLFDYNEALVISDGITARIGSLTADKERFQVWRTVENEKDKPAFKLELETVIKGFFNKKLLLDYLRYFIIFEQDGDKIIKKIAGYHQFHAVRAAVDSAIHASGRKGGVVWHTQGSGKSISMCCFVAKLSRAPEMENPTFVIVTDRNDLDGQLYQTFCDSVSLLGQTPIQADSRDTLREELSNRTSGGIYFTTIQKFSTLEGEEKHPVLCNRSNVIVISDEAHRSQYGLKARFDRTRNTYTVGYARHMREALPNATFLGFTGTPIESSDHDTRAVFGDYISIYDIQDAVNDQATVPIFYESRLAKLDIDRAKIDELNREAEEVLEEDEIEQRENTKSKWAQLAKLVGAKARLKELAADLVAHYEKRTASLAGKAMIVCMSRQICVDLYNEIIALRPAWHSDDPEKGAIKIIMTGSATDPEDIAKHVHSKHVKKRLEKRFKTPHDELKLVIVRDMWLTGFDAPCCHTMYIDKPMQGHTLMQAIARVNRVFKDKPGGLVVDYIGIANELKEALKTYTQAHGKGQPTLNIQEAFRVFQTKLELVRGFFNDFDYSSFKTDTLSLLPLALDHILGLEDGKKRFLDEISALSRAYALCSTLDAAKPYEMEIAFFEAVKAVLMKYTEVDRKKLEGDKNSLLRQLLDNAVSSTGVEDIFALSGVDKPDIGLLSDEFLEELKHMKTRNLAVELLEKLLKDEIKYHCRNNLVMEKKFGDRLVETMNKYHNRTIETAMVIEAMIEMAKDFRRVKEHDAKLGLTRDEKAFYDALADNESAVRELGDEVLKKIAVEITEKLRKSTTVDWQKRDEVRAKLRLLVRSALRRYKYPPDKREDAVDLILKQAEVLCDDWE